MFAMSLIKPGEAKRKGPAPLSADSHPGIRSQTGSLLGSHGGRIFVEIDSTAGVMLRRESFEPETE